MKSKPAAAVGKSAVQRFVMAMLTMEWGLLQREFFGGRLIFSSPIHVHWFVWPVITYDPMTSKGQWYYCAIAVYWLRRGFRLEWKHPDAP